jgi:hypothetical protein
LQSTIKMAHWLRSACQASAITVGISFNGALCGFTGVIDFLFGGCWK